MSGFTLTVVWRQPRSTMKAVSSYRCVLPYLPHLFPVRIAVKDCSLVLFSSTKTETKTKFKDKNYVLNDETQFKPYTHRNFIKTEFLGTRWYLMVVGEHIKNIHLHSCKHKTVTLKLTLT